MECASVGKCSCFLSRDWKAKALKRKLLPEATAAARPRAAQGGKRTSLEAGKEASHPSICSFSEQISTEGLLCAGHCSRL